MKNNFFINIGLHSEKKMERKLARTILDNAIIKSNSDRKEKKNIDLLINFEPNKLMNDILLGNE